MHDLCMKWCNNPFEKDDLLLLKRSHINNLLWFSENDSELLIKKIYLIAQWKQNDLFRFHKKILSKRQKQKILLPKKVFLSDKFLVVEHR
jgi:hypothetical protein